LITRKQAQRLLDHRFGPEVSSETARDLCRTVLTLYDAVDKLGETSRRLQQALDLSDKAPTVAASPRELEPL
jgi:hypothetical protein